MEMKVIAIAALLLCGLAVAESLRMHNVKPRNMAHALETLPALHKRHALITNTPVHLGGGYLTYGAYFVNVTVDGKPFELLVDTGSSNLMVKTSAPTGAAMSCDSAACGVCQPAGSKCSGCAFGPKFCNSNGQCAAGITYGGGSSALGGHYTTSKVCIGSTHCADKATVGIIDHPVNFPVQEGGGIIGFAHPFNACNPTCVPPILQSVKETMGVPLVFGQCLVEGGGMMDIGYVNSSRHTGALQYAPITMPRWYNLGLEHIYVGTKRLQLPKFLMKTTNDQIGAFVDSGTTVILMAPAVYGALVDEMKSSFLSFPGIRAIVEGNGCIDASQVGDLAQYPPLVFEFAGEKAGSTFKIEVPASRYLMLSGSQRCAGIGPAVGVGVVLGDVFLADQYVVYDQERGRVGFAPLATGGCAN